MKTIRILITVMGISLFLILSGCSNDSSSDDTLPDKEYFITFKVNGKQKEYKGNYEDGNLLGIFNAKGDKGYVSSWFTGLKNSSESKQNFISFSILDVNDHQVNETYTNKETTNKDYLFLATYIDENGENYSTVNNKILIPEGGILDGELIFTIANDQLEKGKFSGTLYNNEDDTPIKITDGEFSVIRLIKDK